MTDFDRLRTRLHDEILNSHEHAVVDHAYVESLVLRSAPLLNASERDALIDAVLSDVHGFGRLDAILSDDGITDVMVVGGRGTWIERDGQLIELALTLSDDEIQRIAERIVGPLGLRVDRASPIVDARLADGSRVNVIVPPLAVDGPCVTVRRFGARNVPLHEIASPAVADLLQRCVSERRNIVVSGGTGAGKTTLLNALAVGIDVNERLITIEDAAELRLDRRHVVRLEARPANAEGVGRTTMRELVRNALRMRPDRIIVGEVRGAEAIDMLQAMNTGHEGSLSTCHANSPRDALFRLETMVLMAAVDLPLLAVRQQLGSTIDVIVQISRRADGSRRVVDVSEVVVRDGVLDVCQVATQYAVVQPFRRPARRAAA